MSAWLSFEGDAMRHSRCAGALRYAVLALVSTALRADITIPVATEPGSNITIKLSSPVTSVPRFGFLPVRVSIENASARDGVWRFRFNAGSPGSFPGVAGSSFELAVPATQTRESWFFIPLAEPGLSINPSAAALATPSGLRPLPQATPPNIDTVWPVGPPGLAPPVITRQSTSSSGGSRTSTFTISQTGPAVRLPPLPASRLPPNTIVTVSPPNAAGDVTRTTTVSVDNSLGGGGGGGGGFGVVGGGVSTLMGSGPRPESVALSNALSKLTSANLMPLPSAGVNTRRSARSNATATAMGGLMEYVVTFSQTGPAAALPLPDVKALPPGFTSVTVNPTINPGEVVREFTYVENVPMASLSPSTSSARARLSLSGGVSPALLSTGATEAEARRVLAPTGLLAQQGPGITTVTATPRLPISSGSSGSLGTSGSLISYSSALFLFEQTGPTARLPMPPVGSLPASVRVTLHPTGTPGTSLRSISYVDPAIHSLLRANAAIGTGSFNNDRTSLARLELMRLGFLRSDAKISQSGSMRSVSSAGPGGGLELHIFSESGPTNLLPDVPTASLPPGVTCRLTTGLLPGEITRNFIVDINVLAASAPPPTTTAGATRPGGPVRATTGTSSGGVASWSFRMTNTPTALAIDVVGPGVGRGRTVFPGGGASPLPPMAIAASLEAAVRSQLVSALLRTPPNFMPVDPAQLPADWRVWSSFNSVILKAEDYVALDAGRRGALRGWVALGGVLFLAPATTGDGSIQVPGDMQVENVGAGRIETFGVPPGTMVPRDVANALQLATLSPGMPNRETLRFAPGSPMGEMVKFEGTDVLWLSLFLVLFAVLIGPVNLFLLAPATKRHRLFVTTPLLSIAGAVAVAGAIVLQDGLGGTGVRRALVVLVPGENQAAVFQEQAARTGFLTRREFPLDPTVLCAPLPTDDQPPSNPLTPATFVREAGRASGEWFRNRSRQAHLLRQLVPTRARVEVVNVGPGGAPTVESTLATELKDFWLRDENGGFWFAGSVGPGRRVTLQVDPGLDPAAVARDFGGDGTPGFTTVLAAATLRAAWQWTARGGPTELAPIGTLPAIRWKDHEITYTGVAARAAGATAPAVNVEKAGR